MTREQARGSWATWTTPLVIYVVSAAAYALLASRHAIPFVFPDEMAYGHMARSVAAGDGISWYGESQSWPAALYILLLAPSWLVASGEQAYELAKATGAIVVCTVVFPVWMLARRLMPPRAAVIPTVLCAAGTWMVSAAGLLTENLALPLSTAALACAVLALREPAARWGWAALAFAAAATAARAQLAVLFAVLLCALLIDVWLAPDRRERLRRHRAALVVLAAVVLAAAVVVLTGSSALGPYADVADFAPGAGDVLAKAGEQWIALAVMSGVLPLAALPALAARASAWRDRDLGPLLCVTAPLVVLLLLQSAYFIAGVGEDGLPWSIERYVQYAVPLLLVLLFAGLTSRALTLPALGIASAVVVLSLLAAPDVRQAVEQRATYATSELAGALGLGTGPALALAGLAVAGVAAVLLARLGTGRASAAIGGLLLAAFLLQGQWFWRWQLDAADQVRAQFPSSLTWVDDNAGGPVTRLYVIQNSFLFQRADVFNEDIAQVLIPPNPGSGTPPLGVTCGWTLDARGAIGATDGCGPIRRRIWNDDVYNELSFHGGRTVARDPALGQIIAVPENPRLRSVIRMPCPPVGLLSGPQGAPVEAPADTACPPAMSVFLWVDSPGTLELTFQGGTRQEQVSSDTRTWQLPPGERTTVRIPVTTPNASVVLRTGWDRSAGTQLVGAEFVSGTNSATLL